MRLARTWQIVATALTVAASLLLLVVPVYSTESASSDGTVTHGSQRLLEVNGAGLFPLLLVPVVLAGAPLVISLRRRRLATVVGTALLFFFVAIALAIGIFYVPALIAAIVAMIITVVAPRSEVAERPV